MKIVFFVCILILATVSCATVTSPGNLGSESSIPPPFNLVDENTAQQISLSAQISYNGGPPFFPPVVYSQDSLSAQITGIFQSRPKHESGVFHSLQAGVWYSINNGRVLPEDYTRNYYQLWGLGGTAAYRFGWGHRTQFTDINVPAIQVEYSYEGGPYLETRKDISKIEDELYLNLWSLPHRIVFGVVPLDYSSSFSRFGNMRNSLEFLWDARLVHLFCNALYRDPAEDVKNRLLVLLFLPDGLRWQISWQPSRSPLYVTGSVGVHTSLLNLMIVPKLGIGYTW